MGDAGVAVTEGLFRMEGDGSLTLLGGRSASSGLTHFPIGEVCPYSGAADVEPVDLPRSGTLWAWTEVTTAPPGYSGPVPYGLGVVEFDTGRGTLLRVIGRLVGLDASAAAHGVVMSAVADEFDDDSGTTVLTWAFAPEGHP